MTTASPAAPAAPAAADAAPSPPPPASFDALGLDPRLVRGLHRQGLTVPTPVQVRERLEERGVFFCSPAPRMRAAGRALSQPAPPLNPLSPLSPLS